MGAFLFKSKFARTTFGRLAMAAAAVATLSTAGTLAVAAPASAAISDCPSGVTCLWKNGNYETGGFGGWYFQFSNGVRDFSTRSWDNFQGPLNDSVSSVYNNGNTQNSYMYIDKNFSGLMLLLTKKSGSNSLGAQNDQMSSAGFSYCINNPSSAMCS